ncbi:hypothetical protein MRX96_012402 [Rhipicephalus microplus]
MRSSLTKPLLFVVQSFLVGAWLLPEHDASTVPVLQVQLVPPAPIIDEPCFRHQPDLETTFKPFLDKQASSTWSTLDTDYLKDGHRTPAFSGPEEAAGMCSSLTKPLLFVVQSFLVGAWLLPQHDASTVPVLQVQLVPPAPIIDEPCFRHQPDLETTFKPFLDKQASSTWSTLDTDYLKDGHRTPSFSGHEGAAGMCSSLTKPLLFVVQQSTCTSPFFTGQGPADRVRWQPLPHQLLPHRTPAPPSAAPPFVAQPAAAQPAALQPATAEPAAAQKDINRRKGSAKVLVLLNPRIPRTASLLLDFIKRESNVSLMHEPLLHFCRDEVVLHAQKCQPRLNSQVITYQDIHDMVKNLVGLHTMCIKKSTEVAKELGISVPKRIIIMAVVASSLERIAEVPVSDCMAISDAIFYKLEWMNPLQPLPFAMFMPRIHEFHNLKMLAVYLANYSPSNFVATVKLVNVDRFSHLKQAAMNKVVAAHIRNPFLVKYYCCFCVKEAYVTIMEYMAGLDLMRVVTKKEYFDTESVRVIMAQLILALEHTHLLGFLHQDVNGVQASGCSFAQADPPMIAVYRLR